jgi:hypothetical protein
MIEKMKFTEEIIIRYMDGELSEEEIQSFEAELKLDKSFADLYERHLAIHNSLSSNKILSPSADFTNRVMESVASLSFSDSKFFNRTRLFVVLLSVIVLATTIYYLSAQFYPAIGGAISNEITLKEFTLDLQPAQQLLSSDILFKVVFYVNGLVILLLLDRAILKPYFIRRRQRYSM